MTNPSGLPVLTGGCPAGSPWVPNPNGAVLGPDGISLGLCQGPSSVFQTMSSIPTPVLVLAGLLAFWFVSKEL